ncbi:hypothetical protein BKA67DRAFT_656757 [Truncatella angustata]|uniref:Uncharacterized protein n=1 Tax=Truncatella angustata TaxID=152316 RepID=A0A9P8UUH0_9PEZI|nr:uncharacterized protein BKA67DRAFT_656757 [Truncatella angustata]KAH6658573.1 hypothetical protein BKA67DRAFT_656757 [Truncatella angustata]
MPDKVVPGSRNFTFKQSELYGVYITPFTSWGNLQIGLNSSILSITSTFFNIRSNVQESDLSARFPIITMISKLILTAIFLGNNIIATPINNGGAKVIAHSERHDIEGYYYGDIVKRTGLSARELAARNVLTLRASESKAEEAKKEKTKESEEKKKKQGKC